MDTSNFMRYILPVGSQAIGGYFGNKAMSDAAGEAAQYQQNAMNQIVGTANQFQDQARQDYQPYQNMFNSGTQSLLNSAITNPQQSAYAQKTNAQLGQAHNALAPNSMNLKYNVADNVQNAQLRDSVDFNLASDPLYQAQQQEIMRQINARNAAMGKLNSSDADSAVARNTAALMEGAYGRQLGDLERANQNAMLGYGMDSDRWNRSLTNANLNNQSALTQYGFESDRYNRGIDNIMRQYGITDKAEADKYGRLIDAANIGMGATNALEGSRRNTLATLGDAYSSGADAMAQSALMQGMGNAQFANQLGNMPMNYQALETMGGLADYFTGGGSNALTTAGGLGAAGLGANAAFGGGAITSGAGSLASGVGAPVSGAAITAASGGGVGAGGGAAAGGAGASGLGSGGAAAGLGAAAPLLAAGLGAAVIGAGAYDTWRKFGGDDGANAVDLLARAERGEKVYTDPKTGQKIDLTNPETLSGIRGAALEQMQWGRGGQGHDRLRPYDGTISSSPNAPRVNVADLSLSEIGAIINKHYAQPGDINKTNMAH